jgi:hypothetical protein
VVNRDRDVIGEDPQDSDTVSMDVQPIHFLYDADVRGSDFIYWVEEDKQFFSESVLFGSYSTTKRVIASLPRMVGELIPLKLSREIDSATGEREFLPEQLVWMTVDNLVRERDTVVPKRVGSFVKNGVFDVQTGDTYITADGRPGRITGVHPGQARRVEAEYEEAA